ncbi:MAG: hypothetical protein JNM39_06360 [Bdellovibrionaceae bacterium]|nr:hypothetical protein [Pseudobdellovibrionaceae bacterium]
MKRREYEIDIIFNGTAINKVIIDTHFEKKHAESINDQIIIQLVNLLDEQFVVPKEEKPPFSYFGEELSFNGKRYRLIWLLEDDHIYIGVVNAYRR